MSGTLALSAPGNTPAIDDKFFTKAWLNYFGDATIFINDAAPLASPTFTGTVTIPILSVTSTSTFGDTAAFQSATFAGSVEIGGNVGFYGTAPVEKPTITGSRSSGAAVTILLEALQAMGLIINSSTN